MSKLIFSCACMFQELHNNNVERKIASKIYCFNIVPPLSSSYFFFFFLRVAGNSPLHFRASTRFISDKHKIPIIMRLSRKQPLSSASVFFCLWTKNERFKNWKNLWVSLSGCLCIIIFFFGK